GHLWNKRVLARLAKIVLVEVDQTAIRTYGTNYIHISEIDRFVENPPKRMTDQEMDEIIDGMPDEAGRSELRAVARRIEPERRYDFLPQLALMDGPTIRGWAQVYGYQAEPEPAVKTIGEYVAELIPDGSTLQVGGGTPSTLLPGLGVFDDKHDLGIHSEMSARGLIKLVEKGVATGRRKNFHPGKAVLSALTASTMEEIRYAHNNPLIELYDSSYVVNISNVAANDNMVSINSALSIDLTGQITSETVFGGRLIAGTGGQPELHMGAVSSRGGRGITCLRSTAVGGVVSRIVAQHDAGAAITVTRGFADYVVTEYGVASLLGKTFRQRAEELISVAHPDFRAELRQEARKLFYPESGPPGCHWNSRCSLPTLPDSAAGRLTFVGHPPRTSSTVLTVGSGRGFMALFW
ncbi:MAG: hypothetical protein IIC81_00275, partial [Chloroflexi bacterium]|nr:hypothetical protein [Chloroflexota bacterium]